MERVTDLGYWMDPYLKVALDSLCYNVQDDWDGVVIVSGDGMVRIGKSMHTDQMAYYCLWKLNHDKPNWLELRKEYIDCETTLFSGAELITKGKKHSKNGVFKYDEARGELDTKKVLQEITITLMDYFNECGKFNHIVFLVIPEFFDLPKGLATNRSEFLINVYRKKKPIKLGDGSQVVKLERGFFEFYSREAKKRLYIIGKKNFNDYRASKYDFFGEFRPFWIVDRDKYDTKKDIYLARDKSRAKTTKDELRFPIALKALCNHVSTRKAAKELEELGLKLDFTSIIKYIHQIPKEIS